MASFCSICLDNLSEAPVPGAPEIIVITPPAAPHSRICGHVFHRYCTERVIRDAQRVIRGGEDPNRPGRCPLCRAAFSPEDLKNIRLDFNSPTCESCEISNDIVKSLQGALEDRDDKISRLEEELRALKLKESQREAGSRIHLEREFTDSNCYNCESKTHNSMSCPNPPYLRFTEATTYGKWAPIEKFNVTTKIPFDLENAGCIITFYSKKLNLRSPTRIQIQAFYGFSFFDDCCWKCASPYHHRGDCPNEDLGIKGICKLLHEINHPLTAEAAAKRNLYRERAELEREELGAHSLRKNL